MNKILRKIFYEMTIIGKLGVSTLKAKGIRPVLFEEFIPNFSQLLEDKSSMNPIPSSKVNP